MSFLFGGIVLQIDSLHYSMADTRRGACPIYTILLGLRERAVGNISTAPSPMRASPLFFPRFTWVFLFFIRRTNPIGGWVPACFESGTCSPRPLLGYRLSVRGDFRLQWHLKLTFGSNCIWLSDERHQYNLLRILPRNQSIHGIGSHYISSCCACRS